MLHEGTIRVGRSPFNQYVKDQPPQNPKLIPGLIIPGCVMMTLVPGPNQRSED